MVGLNIDSGGKRKVGNLLELIKVEILEMELQKSGNLPKILQSIEKSQ